MNQNFTLYKKDFNSFKSLNSFNSFNSFHFNGLGLFNYFNRSFNNNLIKNTNEFDKCDKECECYSYDPLVSLESLFLFLNEFLFLLKLKFTLIGKRIITYNLS
jgi:hypothetical protein